MNFANAGIPVTLIDMKRGSARRGVKRIKDNYAVTVSKGRLNQADMDKRMGLITRRDSRRRVQGRRHRHRGGVRAHGREAGHVRQARQLCQAGRDPRHQHLDLDVDEIAAVTKRPQDVIGTHFFSPANVMRLLEVVRAQRNRQGRARHHDEARQDAARKCRCVAGVCDGFIGNRDAAPYGREAHFLHRRRRSCRSRSTRPRRIGAGDGPVRRRRYGGQRHRLVDPQAPLRRAADICAIRRSSTKLVRASAASARRPARAGIATKPATASRSPIRSRGADHRGIEAKRASSAARSPTRKSSSAAFTR